MCKPHVLVGFCGLFLLCGICQAQRNPLDDAANPLDVQPKNPLDETQIPSKPTPRPSRGPVTFRQLPAGFAQINDERTQGTILVAENLRGDSADAMLNDALKAIAAAGVEGAIKITKRAADNEKGVACAGFRARITGDEVEGFIVTVANERIGQGAALLAKGSLDRVLESLAAQLIAHYPQFLGGAHRFYWAPIGTTGGLMLPMRWNITSFDGNTVYVAGPEGQLGAFGVGVQVVTRAGTVGMLGQLNPPVVCDHCDPQTGLMNVFPQWMAFNRQIDPRLPDFRITRILQTTPLQRPVLHVPGLGNFDGGEAANILFDAEMLLNTGQRVPYRALIMVYVGPERFNQWTFYYSSVAAPTEIFNRDLPVLMQVWQSRRLDQKALWESWARARMSMTKAMELLNDAAVNQAKAVSVGNEKWSAYIREDYGDGEGGDGDNKPDDNKPDDNKPDDNKPDDPNKPKDPNTPGGD